MLISFAVENFLSFNNRVEFTTVASKERQHSQRVFKSKTHDIRLVPTSVIYGANASGKSNLYSALEFLRNLVTESSSDPDDLIPVRPFRLDPKCIQSPSNFTIEIMTNKRIYRYFVSLTSTRVESEVLEELRNGKQTIIFSRQNGCNWDISFFDTIKCDGEIDFIKFKSRDTLPNRLFVSELRGKNIPFINDVAEWFAEDLILIAPDSQFGPLQAHLTNTSRMKDFFQASLKWADTGVNSISLEAVSFKSLNIPSTIKEMVRKALTKDKDGTGFTLSPLYDGRRFSFKMTDGEIEASQLMLHHLSVDGSSIPFELSDESTGTKRLLDLLPMLYDLIYQDQKSVYFVDELDRSLHTTLTRRLLEFYLSLRNESSRGQLLFTTHDTDLMDQSLFRRDELWVIEKNEEGASELMSISDFAGVRNDKDIRKSYLLGRFGGVPRISSKPTSTQKGS